jgi:hypothetical protein
MDATQPPIQSVPGTLSVGEKRLEREADHSPPSSAEVKEWVESYLQSCSTPSWRGIQLKAQSYLDVETHKYYQRHNFHTTGVNGLRT